MDFRWVDVWLFQPDNRRAFLSSWSSALLPKNLLSSLKLSSGLSNIQVMIKVSIAITESAVRRYFIKSSHMGILFSSSSQPKTDVSNPRIVRCRAIKNLLYESINALSRTEKSHTGVKKDNE